MVINNLDIPILALCDLVAIKAQVSPRESAQRGQGLTKASGSAHLATTHPHSEFFLRHGSHQVQNKRRKCDLIDKCESPSATRTRLPDTGFLDCTGWDRSAMILPGCTRGHIRARYVLQGYLIRNLMFGQRRAFLLAINGSFCCCGGGPPPPKYIPPPCGHRWAFFPTYIQSPKCDLKT